MSVTIEDYASLLADLRHESDQLAEHLDGLAYEQWGLATPAQGWSIHDQVSHLAFFDHAARLALTQPLEFRALAETLMAEGMDFPDRIAAHHRILAPDALLDWFTAARRDLLASFTGEDPRRRLPWFGPDMSVASSATARLMETWAQATTSMTRLASSTRPAPVCAASPTSVCGPSISPIPSTASKSLTSRCGSNYVPPMDNPGSGGRPMPSIGSPARHWISCSPPPNAGTGPRRHWLPPGRSHYAGST